MAKILVIEDDTFVRTMLREALKHFGYSVVEAVDGNEGLAKLAEQGADLLLTDLLMPEKEGFEILLELKRQRNQVKTIAMSGGGRNGTKTDYLQIAKHLGADRVLAKPFTTTQLLQLIKELLDDPESGQARRAGVS